MKLIQIFRSERLFGLGCPSKTYSLFRKTNFTLLNPLSIKLKCLWGIVLHARQNITLDDNTTVQERVSGKFKSQLGKYSVALSVRGETEAGDPHQAKIVSPEVDNGDSGFSCVALAAVRGEDAVSKVLRRCG